MGKVFLKSFLFIAVATSGFQAGAGISSCRSQASQAEKDCDSAVKQANANDAARSANTAAGSGNDINQNCQKIGQDIGKQQGNLGQAQGRCQADDAKCDSACVESQTDAQMEPQRSMEMQQISQRKQQCHANIKPKLAQLGQALGNLAGNAPQADACKQASDKGQDGKPPQMPPMQPPQNQGKQQDQKNALSCDSTEGARYSDCNSAFVAKCTKDMTATACDTFSDRYCGSAGGGSQADVSLMGSTQFATGSLRSQSSTSSTMKTASVVVDKRGEGLGSSFCKMVIAYKFCKAGGRSDCPSCRGIYSYSSSECQNDPKKCIPSLTGEQLSAAQTKCPSDPAFLDPEVQRQIANGGKTEEPVKPTPEFGAKSAERVGSGATASGGGPSGSLSGANGAGSGQGSLDGATPESVPVGTSVDMSTGGGGGGSRGPGSFSEQSTDDENKDGKAPFTQKPLLPAQAVAGLAKDISNEFGPNLFSISTAVYRNMCAAGKLVHCTNKK